ncbi:hypothetical protein [Streptacidiphilus neutrinimicus]|uniref:hypothetical protein n=1 Tax=Streptacidiphilus neutrinimicus TaxID=105420 RepID=UPI0005A65B8E|nr:hypothetical protein [Streptacidiphilus neutrinimicus]
MTIAIEAPTVPASNAFRPYADNGLKATFMGLMGKVTLPLRRIDDARLVTTTGTVTSKWIERGTTWLLLCSDDYEVGRVALDKRWAHAIPDEAYAVGQRVDVSGVARTMRGLKAPFIAVRELSIAD